MNYKKVSLLITLVGFSLFNIKEISSELKSKTITIKAVGDIQPGTDFPNNRLPAAGGASLFSDVQDLLGGADILHGNFESTLTAHPTTYKNTNRAMIFAFRTPPSYAAIMKQVGFDVMNVANNHSRDFTDKGYRDTIHFLEKAGVVAIGEKQKFSVIERKGVKIAFIGFSYLSYHNSINDIPAAVKLIKEAKAAAPIVIISVHAGAEGASAAHTKNATEIFYRENRGNIVAFAHKAIDAGADLIIGHGPHVPRAMEVYKNRLIAYSLGNFMGYRTFSTRGLTGVSLILEAEIAPTGEFISGKIIPLRLSSVGTPSPDQKQTAIKTIIDLTKADFPKTGPAISSDGRISKK